MSKNASSTETSVVVDSNFAINTILEDKLDYAGITLLSQNQNKIIKTVKGNNEK